MEWANDDHTQITGRQKRSWRVVNQTNKKAFGPGCPNYGWAPV